MSNPQDDKRPNQQNENPEKSKSGQPNEPGSKPESRQGQGGRMDDKKELPKKKQSEDEDTEADGNR